MGVRGAQQQQQQQRAEASYEELVARLCDLGCRLHHQALPQAGQCLAGNAAAGGGAAGSGSGGAGSSCGGAARGSSIAAAAASSSGSKQAAVNAGSAGMGAGGGSSAGRGTSSASGQSGRGSRNKGTAARATGSAAAPAAAGGLPPRAAELAAAAVDLAAIGKMVTGDPSGSTPDIFTAAHQRGQLHGLVALLGWCLRLAVPSEPPFAPVGGCPGAGAGGRGSTSGGGTGAGSGACPTPPPPPAALWTLGTDNDDLRAAASRALRWLSGALHACGSRGRFHQPMGGLAAADMVRLLQLLVRGGCFELTQAALARCCYALEPALPPPPPAAAEPASLPQQPLRRARLGSSGWSLLWLWLSFTHDMIACAEWCLSAAAMDASFGRRQVPALRDSLPDPALALKLLDCYSRTLLCAAAAVAGGGGSGGGAPPAPQQADALARAMRFYANMLPDLRLLELAPAALEPHQAACPALSYALAAHAVHTCAAVDGGGTYGLRCGQVASAVAAAVAPGGALGRGGDTISRLGEVPAAGADSGGEEAGGAMRGVVLPLLGPGDKVLQPPEQLLQRRRRAGGGDCRGSGGSSGGGSSIAGPAVAAAAAAALPLQAAVTLDVTLAERAAEAWQTALAIAWLELLLSFDDLDSNHSPRREQLRLYRTQPGCLRAAYGRASWLAEGMQKSAEAAATGLQHPQSEQLITKTELDRWLAAARSCPLLHCGGAFEVGMRLAAAAAGCMADLPTTAPVHRQGLRGVQELAVAAVAGRRADAAAGSSGIVRSMSSGCGGEGGSATRATAGAGEDQQQTARQPQPRRRLELVGVSLAALVTTGLKLARQAWQDTSALWLPKPDAIALDGSSSSSGGNGSCSDSSSSSGSSGGSGGVSYPPLSVQRDLLAWWRVALGWVALSDLDQGGNGSASEGEAAYSVRTAWRGCLRLLGLDLCASGMRHAEPAGRAAAGWTYLPPLRLRPCPDVAAALVAGYLPVYGRVMRRAADRLNLVLVGTRRVGVGGSPAAWAQLLVFGPQQQAQAFVADVAVLARRRIEMLRAAVAAAAAAAEQTQQQGKAQTEREQQQTRSAATATPAPVPAPVPAVAAAAAKTCAATVPPLSVSVARELAWESLSLCTHASDWCSAGGLATSFLSTSLLVAFAPPGGSSSSSRSGSTSAQAASPLVGLQLTDEAAVAARTVAAARAVASQLLPAMADTMRAVALAVENGRHSAGPAVAPLLSRSEAMGFTDAHAAMLRWVPLLLRAAALAPVGEVANGAARARPDEDEDARDQQQQRDGAERELPSLPQCVWRRRDYWERLLWRDIDLPALLSSLCGMMRAADDEGRDTAAAPALAAAATAGMSGQGGSTGVSQPAAASSGAGRSQTARTLNGAILPELVVVMTSLLQLAPLRLLHVPAEPHPPKPLQPVAARAAAAAAAAAAGQQGRRGRTAEAASGSFATAASPAACADGAAAADTVSTGAPAVGCSRIDVPRVSEHLRAWGCCGDGPPLATHLAGVLERAAAGDWEAVRAGSRWLLFGAAVTHAPGDVAARLWRQQRQVLEHGVGYGVPLEASVMDGALGAAAALLRGQTARAV
ncbi:hypothetical protein HXX76_012845 [Chlamydomonas incerta]|uniref:Uncharacterized protein n=1 Tax=Chlamydomonas incerta TaxID=51695 RepID=A0A835VT25_CHLIN|nr:hypothetical protein HXX76_012845 [Chlamydomonas incerta]|eukprot:KAG2426790.1 hypothetical protein HXX76_012845 [Chlamydomonas incerta]